MALLETLTDPFTGGTIDAAKWAVNSFGFTQDATHITPSQTGGVLQVVGNGGTGTAQNGIVSVNTYDLTNSYAYVKVPQVSLADNQHEPQLFVGVDANNWYAITFDTATLAILKKVAGTQTTVFSETYDSSAHAYWRIRHGTAGGGSGDTIYCDTSTDGVTWTNKFSEARAFTITAVKASLQLLMFGTWGSSITVQFDDFNGGAAGLSAGTLSLGATGTTSQALSLATNTAGTSPYSNQLQRAPDASGSPGTYANIGSAQAGATASWTDTGLTPGTKYWWRVVVTDNVSATVNSNAVTATTLSASVTAPSPAKLVANTVGNLATVTGVATTWLSGTTWSVAGMTGAAVTAKSFIDATHYQLTITSSTVDGSGTLTLTNSADGTTATITVVPTTGGGAGRRRFQ